MQEDKPEIAATAAVKNEPIIPHSIIPHTVVVHPLVLLSVVDHFKRVAHNVKDKRVVGVLLGETFKGKVDVSNSFAVPFEEDANDASIWFWDHDFLEKMTRMFFKVSAKERIVGFYSTGPTLRRNDLAMEADFRHRYLPQSAMAPVLVIIDVNPDKQGLPISSYVAVESQHHRHTFVHVESCVEAYEAEEVGVEALLRDVNDPTVSTVAGRVRNKMKGLEALSEHVMEMKAYLEKVRAGQLPMNVKIVHQIQEIVNLLPTHLSEQVIQAHLVKTNDAQLVLYVASLVRSILAQHTLLNNKLALKT